MTTATDIAPMPSAADREIDRLTDVHQLRALVKVFRDAMIAVHQQGGHHLDPDPDCQRALDECDGDLACADYRRWQAEYMNALNASLSPSGVHRHACGTCRQLAARQQPLEHDACHARAQLIQAPDSNWEEWPDDIEGRRKLPARFHIPTFVEVGSPPYWCCAACSTGDGIYSWPCEVAIENGEEVFIR